MDSHTLEVLTARIEAAERALGATRRAIWLGSFVVLLVFGGAVWWALDPTFGRGMGQAPAAIEAQRFLLRDGQGAARAVLESMDSGGTQLVFFRDPLPGDSWREHASGGPFSFGVRSLTSNSQMTLSNRDGMGLQLTPRNLAFGSAEAPKLLLGMDSGESRIYLADSSGTMQVLNAGLLAEVAAKRSVKSGPPPKHRRRR